MEAQLKNVTNRYLTPEDTRKCYIKDQFTRANKHLIKVHIVYQSSKVDMTVLDARYTLSDKIANFGGTFGIWAELTGFSLLGIINMFLLSFKLLFKLIQFHKLS